MPYIAREILLVVALEPLVRHKFLKRGDKQAVVFVLEQAIVRFDEAVTAFCEQPDFTAAAHGQRKFVSVAVNLVASDGLVHRNGSKTADLI